MIILEKWFITYNGMGYNAIGVVYGHTSPNCTDGTEIHTSLIESAEEEEDGLILRTLNSEYHVSYDEMDCEYLDPLRSLRIFERFWAKHGSGGIPAEVVARYSDMDTELFAERRSIEERLPEGALFLELHDEYEFYFRQAVYKSAGGATVHIPRLHDLDTHKGNFVAVVGYIVSFIPYDDGNIEFLSRSALSFKDPGMLGIIRNSGSGALNIRFSWGRTVIIAPDSEIEVSEGMGGFLPLTCTTQTPYDF